MRARLDGVPLAIELAAARCRSLTVDRILAGLTDTLALLTGGSRTALPRQQTLEAAIAWSYDLLTEADRVLLRRLSVFAGGCTLDAAEAMCAASPLSPEVVLDGLDHLVAQSLLSADMECAQPRYRMLETVRQFASRCLEHSGEREDVSARHRSWVVQMLHEVGEALVDDTDRTARRQLIVEWPNVTATVERASGPQRAELVAEISSALWSVAGHSAFSADIISWVDRALSEGSPRAVLFGIRGVAHGGRGAWPALLEDFDLARSSAAHEGDLVTLGRVSLELSGYLSTADFEQAARLLEHAEELATSTHDRLVLSRVDLGRMILLFMSGRRKELVRFLQGGTITAPYSLAGVPLYAALCALDNLDYDVARRNLEIERRDWGGDTATEATASTDSTLAKLAIDLGSTPDIDLQRALARALQRAEFVAMAWYAVALRMWLAGTGRWREVIQLCQPAVGWESLNMTASYAGYIHAWVAEALANLGQAAEADEEISHAERIVVGRGWPSQECEVCLVRAEVDGLAGRFELAEQAAHRALALALQEEARRPGVLALERLAAAAAGLDSPVEAARLWGAAASTRDRTGFRYRAPTCPVDADAHAEAVAQGRTMTYEEAVAYRATRCAANGHARATAGAA